MKKTNQPKIAPRREKPASRALKPKAKPETWNFQLYVAGQTPRSLAAFTNLKRLCEAHLPGKYHIEVIDLVREPARAQGDQIVALPTLIRKLPSPIRRVIGDLSNVERVVVAMELKSDSKQR